MRLPLLIGFVLCMGFNSYAQRSINTYKYVVVPDFYTFLKSKDQYQLNSLTKFLFNKYGFEAYIEGDDYPDDLLPKSCNILYADIINDSNFLSTTLKVSLTDCDGNVVYVSEKGRSKEKEYKKSYHEALRDAFTSIQELKYVYTPDEVEEEIVEDRKESKSPVVTISETKADELEPEKVINTEKEEKSSAVLPETSRSSTLEERVVIYSSSNSSYSIHQKGNNFMVYDDNEKIGDAKETSTGVFLVQTTAFNGIGRIEGSSFIIERSIKGVDGLVKMTFTKQ